MYLISIKSDKFTYFSLILRKLANSQKLRFSSSFKCIKIENTFLIESVKIKYLFEIIIILDVFKIKYKCKENFYPISAVREHFI